MASLLRTEPERERYWRERMRQLEVHESRMGKSVRRMFSRQRAKALTNLETAVNRNHVLLTAGQASQDYVIIALPLLLALINQELNSGYQLINPGAEIPALTENEAVRWLRTRIGWAADTVGQETADQLSSILADGYSQGLSMEQIAQNIQNATAFSDSRSLMIARTEIMQASNKANLMSYDAAGVDQVEWLTARDERVCEICQPMDGDIENINEAPPLPESTHPNCRCIWIPYIGG